MPRVRRLLNAARTRLRSPQPSTALAPPLESRLRQLLRPYAKAKLWNKCFCIGAHKTGTTTLAAVLELMGFDVAPQQEIEMSCTRQVQHGSYTELIAQVQRYDAFQDSPFAQGLTYVALDAMFPGSRFILTYRDPEAWFASLTGFHGRLMGKPAHTISRDEVARSSYIRRGYSLENREYYWLNSYSSNYEIKTDWSLHYDRDHYTTLYEQRNREIVRYFKKRPADLLVLDLSQHYDVSAIAAFLDLPTWVNFSLPRLNATDPSADRVQLERLSPELETLLAES